MAKWKNDNLISRNKPLKEGVGAGYTLTFYNIKLTNVKLGKIKKEDSGGEVSFTADIVPAEVEFSCNHPYWFIDSNTSWIEFDDGEIDTEVTEAKIIGGTVKGIFDLGYPDETNEGIAEEITSMTYDISDSYSDGYVHHDIAETIKMESKYGISDFYLTSATIKLDKDTVDMMNTAIEIAKDPEGYYFGELHNIR